MIPILLCSPAVLAAEPSLPNEHYELANGLDVVLIEDRTAPVVAVDVWYHVGSRVESAGKTGFAHLFEHLMFEGSPSNPDGYFVPLERVGANVNGSTTTDRTNYFEVLPREELPLALFLEADRLANLLEIVDQPRLDNQKEVVRNERRQRIETVPFGDAGIVLDSLLYPPGHGYRHPVIGSHEDLAVATLDDVHAFFRRWYQPDNAVLVVAGDFDANVARELIATSFGGIPRGDVAPPPPPPPPALRGQVELRTTRDVPTARVWIAWHTPEQGSLPDAALDLLAQTLAGDRSARLTQELVERRGVAQEVVAYQASRGWSSQFVVRATPATGHTTDEVVAAIDDVLAGLAGHPLEQAELDAARANLLVGAWSALETALGKAEFAHACMQRAGTPDCLGQELARYQAATPASVGEAVTTYLGGDRVVLHVSPLTPAPVAPVAVGPPKKRPPPDRRGR